MSNRLVIGVDFDDVLAATNDALARFHNAMYDTSYTTDQVTNWESALKTIWGVSEEEKARRIDEFICSDEHARMLPMPGAKDAIQKLGERYEIVVITARTRIAERETREWLEKHLPILKDKIFFANTRDYSTILSKKELCCKLGVGIFIDDAAHQIEYVAPHVSTALLFDMPWNRSYRPQVENVVRVLTWEDIQSLLL